MTTERKCPDCGCCCDYSSPCCNLKGGNADHPGGCKKITSGNLYISVPSEEMCEKCRYKYWNEEVDE